jgi:H+/Cl- antiporter ClcA
MNMTRDEAIEVYKVQHEKFRQTKELQWKINLASWALIAIAITYSDKLKGLSVFQIWFVSGVFWIAQMIFSWRTQLALEVDKKISKHILDTLNLNTNKDLNIVVNVNGKNKKIEFQYTGIWWLIFQALTTGILLGLLIMVTKY